MSDSDLVRRGMAGDPTAVAELWARHRRMIAGLLLARGCRSDELQDTLQEVAVVFVERLCELREPARLRPWLASVASNALRMAARSASRRHQHVRVLPGETPEPVDPASESSTHATGVRDALERTLASARRLEPDYREPLLLRAVEGLSPPDIAEILGLPLTTIETRLARARAMLRRDLAAAAEADAESRRAARQLSAAPNRTTVS